MSPALEAFSSSVRFKNLTFSSSLRLYAAAADGKSHRAVKLSALQKRPLLEFGSSHVSKRDVKVT